MVTETESATNARFMRGSFLNSEASDVFAGLTSSLEQMLSMWDTSPEPNISGEDESMIKVTFCSTNKALRGTLFIEVGTN